MEQEQFRHEIQEATRNVDDTIEKVTAIRNKLQEELEQ